MFKPEDVKLPLFDGRRKHPLLQALERAEHLGLSMSDLARSLNVTPQSIWAWKQRALTNRNFLLPAEQVPALSRYASIPPFYFRPDLWPNEKWVF
jgi:hypothetical protein